MIHKAVVINAVIVLLYSLAIDALQIPRSSKRLNKNHRHRLLSAIHNRRSYLNNSATVATSFLIMSSSSPTTAQTTTGAVKESRSLNVALLGAGIFASTCHAPILKSNPDIFNCVAVWSRRLDSASKLVSTTLHQSKAYSDLDEVLAIKDLDAVIMALPLDVQPDYVVKCLKANKHVLSEKPIAPTVEEATKLLNTYKKEHSHLIWSVAENFRYEPAVIRASELIKDTIGDPFLASLTVRAPFLPDNKFLNTYWRKEPSWYGGLFIDAFVHASAMLRSILGDAKSVSAITSSNADFIPGVDTLAANIFYENDLIGSVSVTYFCKEMKFELEIIGSRGKMTVTRKTDGPGYHIQTVNSDGVRTDEEFGFGGLQGELFGFAAACKGEDVDRNTPSEAFLDLAFVEACLLSGKDKGMKKDVAQI